MASRSIPTRRANDRGETHFGKILLKSATRRACLVLCFACGSAHPSLMLTREASPTMTSLSVHQPSQRLLPAVKRGEPRRSRAGKSSRGLSAAETAAEPEDRGDSAERPPFEGVLDFEGFRVTERSSHFHMANRLPWLGSALRFGNENAIPSGVVFESGKINSSSENYTTKTSRVPIRSSQTHTVKSR